MSGVHMTVEESIKLSMMRYFNCSELDDITLVNPRAPESIALSGFDRIIDVEYRGKTITVGYDRFNVAVMLTGTLNYLKSTIIIDGTITPEVVYKHIYGIYGICIPESEIDYSSSAIVDDKCTFVMKKDSKYYTGAFAVPLLTGDRTYPAPKHEWLLMGNLRNTGTSKMDMVAPFKFVTKDSGQWATLTGGRTPTPFGEGIVLPTEVNWTLDFEFMVTRINDYNMVFAEKIPGDYVPGTLSFYKGLLYESHLTHGVHGMKLEVNVPSRHTLVCKNNHVSYYFNGVRVESWNTQTSRTAWRGFRTTSSSLEQFDENVSHIRKLRSWDVAIEGMELENLFRDDGSISHMYPMPDHEWLLNGVYTNTGKNKKAITSKFKFVTMSSGQWATLTGGRTPQPIGVDISLTRTGNWIVDFEMLVTQTPLRNTVFQSGLSDFSGNTLMFYKNVLYIPYGNSSNLHTFAMPENVPTRHTIRCIDGVIYYYMDGLLAQSFNNPGTEPWTYFRSTFYETEQMEEDKTFLRNIRFWVDGMTDDEFTEMLYADTSPDIEPVHHWPLTGNIVNIGSHESKPPFGPPVAFSKHEGGTRMANLTVAKNHPLGTTFNASGDWTIATRVIDPTPGLKGFITTQSSLTHGVSSKLYMKKLTTYLSSYYLNNWYTSDDNILMKPGKLHSVVMTKRGLSYRMYVDGVLVQRVSSTKAVVGDFTHFGAYNHTSLLDPGVKFYDLRIYDYGMSLRQVHKYVSEIDKYTGYSLPDHEWLMNGTAANTGKNKDVLAPPVKYKTISGKQYATFASNQLIQRFGVILATTLNWTIDIEVLYTKLAHYEHFLCGEVGADNQNGIFKFQYGNFYETYCNSPFYGVREGEPIRITLVCADGKVTYYRNTAATGTWYTSSLARRPAITGFGSLYNSESHVAMDKFHFRNFRYYDRALSKEEVDELFLLEDVASYRPPVHHWPLNGSNANVGTGLGSPFNPPVVYDSIGGRTMARLVNSGKFPLGSSITLSPNYSIVYEIFTPSDIYGIPGLLTDGSADGADGVINVVHKSRIFSRMSTAFTGTSIWEESDVNKLIQVNKYCVCVLTRDADLNYVSWINGKMVAKYNATSPIANVPLSHFGTFYTYQLPTHVRFGNIAIYDYVLSEEQVIKHYNNEYGNRQ